MRIFKTLVFFFSAAFFAVPLAAQQPGLQPTGALEQVVYRIIAREKLEVGMLRRRAPIVETYIQKQRVTESDGSWIPDGDRYFIGRADFSNGLDLHALDPGDDNPVRRGFVSLMHLFDFGGEFLPKGFLQMIYPDSEGLDTQRYHFDYIRREFLGEVRVLVFDVTPAQKGARGRFIGRIWADDQDFAIVRFNGSYSGHENDKGKFHFDSWRVNAGPDFWLPAFIYAEEISPSHPLGRSQTYRAQTRLWGYNSSQARMEQELSRVLVESSTPVVDQAQQNNDLTPLQQTRAWNQQAVNNVIDKLERDGMIAPEGDIDKILNTVVNNLEITNNLSLDPDIRCRVLMTSTLESFSMGNTIILSRGLVDVLPDEASLAAMLSKEMGYILTTPKRVDTRYAFYDRLRFEDKYAFPHFDFERSPQEIAAAGAKAAELLKASPYKDQLDTPEMFIAELQSRVREIPNLISPRVGDAALLKLPVAAKTGDQETPKHIVALPLGGRIKLDPLNDTLEMLKTQPAGSVSDREKMPFEITPFMIYLTRAVPQPPKTSDYISGPRGPLQ